MKKLISLFAVLIMIILMSINVFAAGSLSVDNVSAKTGDVFTLEINLSENSGIIATRIFIDYDSKYLKLENAENGNVFPQDKALFGKNLDGNPYSMLWDDALGTNTTANGTLAKVTFKVKAENPSGKTVIKVTVDKGSTFDEALNVKFIEGTECTVSFPTKETLKNETLKNTTTKYVYSEATELTVTTTKQSETEKSTTQKYEMTAPTVQEPSKIIEETLEAKVEVSKEVTENVQTSEFVVDTSTEVTEINNEETSVNQTDTETEKVEDVSGSDILTEVPANGEERNFNKKWLWSFVIIPIAVIVLVIKKKVEDGRNVK